MTARSVAAPFRTASLSPASRPSFVTRFRVQLAAPLGWYDRWLQRRALSDLDDHLLRDIGVAPDAARHESGKPFWR